MVVLCFAVVVFAVSVFRQITNSCMCREHLHVARYNSKYTYKYIYAHKNPKYLYIQKNL